MRATESKACSFLLFLAACTTWGQFELPRQPEAPWYQRIDAAPKDPQSDAVIAFLNSAGGWGLGRLQIDFSLSVLQGDSSTPLRDFEKTGDFYPGECDDLPMPVPEGGHLEGESGYACEGDGDCHLIVSMPGGRLYEMWRADIRGGDFLGGCLALWNLALPYAPEGRGEGCTSADAAGLPIAPLVFTADEVAAGEIGHALRFALPNDRIRHKTYVRPATHATGAASGGQDAPPYGARLRLKADYDLSGLPNEAARTVARAMQRYGIVLADGGNVALMGLDDRDSQAKWDGLLGSRDLDAIPITALEMVEAGERFTWGAGCALNGRNLSTGALPPHSRKAPGGIRAWSGFHILLADPAGKPHDASGRRWSLP